MISLLVIISCGCPFYAAFYALCRFNNKKEQQSFEEIVEYWVKAHSKIEITVIGLIKDVINPVNKRKYPDSPVNGFLNYGLTLEKLNRSI